MFGDNTRCEVQEDNVTKVKVYIFGSIHGDVTPGAYSRSLIVWWSL